MSLYQTHTTSYSKYITVLITFKEEGEDKKIQSCCPVHSCAIQYGGTYRGVPVLVLYIICQSSAFCPFPIMAHYYSFPFSWCPAKLFPDVFSQHITWPTYNTILSVQNRVDMTQPTQNIMGTPPVLALLCPSFRNIMFRDSMTCF